MLTPPLTPTPSAVDMAEKKNTVPQLQLRYLDDPREDLPHEEVIEQKILDLTHGAPPPFKVMEHLISGLAKECLHMRKTIEVEAYVAKIMFGSGKTRLFHAMFRGKHDPEHALALATIAKDKFGDGFDLASYLNDALIWANERVCTPQQRADAVRLAKTHTHRMGLYPPIHWTVAFNHLIASSGLTNSRAVVMVLDLSQKCTAKFQGQCDCSDRLGFPLQAEMIPFRD